jgi:cytochrome c peroxidase
MAFFKIKITAVLSGLFVVMISFKGTEPILVVPPGWPKPVYDNKKNPLTVAGVALGRQLYYEPLLSSDTTISCASCHLQATGFAHVDHPLSHGIFGRIGKRNAPALMNLAWSTSFMWDGGVNHLDMQPINPISSPNEMNETMGNVVQKINNSTKYRKLFQEAFGDSLATGQKVLLSLSQFVLTLQSYNSRYDRYSRQEPGASFTEQELNGLRIFRIHCNTCHTEPLFTNHDFANNGLPVDYELMDIGRMKITQKPADSLKFKVPTLRNIQFTYPYMHDGRFKKLLDVINHYSHGIQPGKTLDLRLQEPIVLTPDEKIDLVAFLLTLTDRDFLFDPQYNFPRE